MSFAAVDGADNREGLAGGELLHEADSLLRLLLSAAASKRQAGLHRAGKASRVP